MLYLHLEDLTIVLRLLGQGLKLRGLHVELRRGAPHAHKHCAFGYRRYAVFKLADGLSVDGDRADRCSVFALPQHVKHQVLVALCLSVGLIAADASHKYRFRRLEKVGVFNRQLHFLETRGADVVRTAFHASCHFGRRRTGVYAVIVNNHAARLLGACPSRQLVDGGCHWTDFHQSAVNLVDKKVGRLYVGQRNGQGLVDDVLAACHACHHTHRQCRAAGVVAHREYCCKGANACNCFNHFLDCVFHSLSCF